MQLAVYQELSECSVHSALQLAVRQDLCLWMIATWLWQEHEVITLPVSPDMTKPLPPKVSSITATVSREFIRVPCCDIQWQPLNKIQVKEKNLISEKNRDGGAVMWKDDRFQEVPKYVDQLASLFQHPNPVSQALIGRLDWKNIHVLRQITELSDPEQTPAVIKRFNSRMSSLIRESAERSLILDKALRGNQSVLKRREMSVSQFKIPSPSGQIGPKSPQSPSPRVRFDDLFEAQVPRELQHNTGSPPDYKFLQAPRRGGLFNNRRQVKRPCKPLMMRPITSENG
ncbi:hypothetical protein BDD12DRAFT_529475 [Trichophaea hybrida]|nr:hypothetical protein BDD12DRAFT_529475 [Trichophaea hybrida]